jgi:hypothetical protein
VKVVEYVGGADPLAAAFTPYNDVSATTVFNEDGTQLESWAVRTHSQGHYIHGLNWWQKRAAMRNGWRLTAVVRLRQGQFSAMTDFAGVGARFFFAGALEGPKLMAQTWTRQLPSSAFRDAQVRGDAHAYHTYELTFDPAARSALLKVDGIPAIRSYVIFDILSIWCSADRGPKLNAWNAGEKPKASASCYVQVLPSIRQEVREGASGHGRVEETRRALELCRP